MCVCLFVCVYAHAPARFDTESWIKCSEHDYDVIESRFVLSSKFNFIFRIFYEAIGAWPDFYFIPSGLFRFVENIWYTQKTWICVEQEPTERFLDGHIMAFWVKRWREKFFFKTS